MKKRLAVLISGSGSNLQAIIDAAEAGILPVEIVLAVSSREDAFGLTRARNHGIPAAVLDPRSFPGRAPFEEALARAIGEKNADGVALAGFMRVLGPSFVRLFQGRLFNIHPALLPSFPGVHAQRQAVEYGVRFSGCTTHFVDEGTDTGPVILQAVVPVLPGDTEETLGQRILAEEHRIYPETLRLWAERRLLVEGRRVTILPPGKGRP